VTGQSGVMSSTSFQTKRHPMTGRAEHARLIVTQPTAGCKSSGIASNSYLMATRATLATGFDNAEDLTAYWRSDLQR